VLSMCAQALLAVAAARPAPPGSGVPASGTAGQPATWADTGKLPASAEDQPPGDEPGLVKVSVPEARRLARLATAPMTATPAPSATPGHDGAAATRPAPDGTTTTPSSQPLRPPKPSPQKGDLRSNKPGL